MSHTVAASISAYDTANAPVLLGVRFTPSITKVLAEGNGSDEANVIWGKDLSIAASTTEEIDLQTELDAYGDALALTDLATLYIEAEDTNPDDVIVKRGASNGFSSLLEASGGYRLPPGEFAMHSGFATGSLAVSGTVKTIGFENVDGTTAAVVKIRLLGRKP